MGSDGISMYIISIAEGFYDVNRGLLVALTGTLLTYIIILVQMKDLFQ